MLRDQVAAGKENGSLPEFYEALTKKQREQFWIDLSPKLGEGVPSCPSFHLL
jgi:hypothetical protein